MVYVKKNKIDITKEPIPVTPSAHYICGGVLINLNTETTLKGLYAIGEASCTYLHGADRLASNSLTEALVFSSRANFILKNFIKNKKFIYPMVKKDFKINKENNPKLKRLREDIKEIMWSYVGIIRSSKSLRTGLKKLAEIRNNIKLLRREGINKELIETENMAIAGMLITSSALKRKESRGCHYQINYPNKNNAFFGHITQTKT